MGILNQFKALVGLGIDRGSMSVRSPDGKGKITFTVVSDPQTNRIVLRVVGLPPHHRGTYEKNAHVRTITYAPDPTRGRRT